MAHLELRSVHLTYGTRTPVRALAGVSLEIAQGEFVAVDGPSGGGKSTLLNVLGLLDAPTAGDYLVDGAQTDAGGRRAARLRSDLFAFVFQSFHLLGRRAVVDSVELGLVHRKVARRERRERALAALEAVGLQGCATQPAHTLSGGQQQRVAIARALASGAPVLLADEPTGNLDTANTRAVMAALRAVHRAGVTVVMVTHDPELARQADRHVHVVDGMVVHDVTRVPPAEPRPVPPPPGRASTVSLTDGVLDVTKSLASRGGRTAGLALAVAAAVGLSVTTTGLTTSAAAQVSAAFDARQNRFVTVSDSPASTDGIPEVVGWDVPDDEVRAEQLDALTGVDAAALVTDHSQHEVSAVTDRSVTTTTVYGVTSGFVTATGSDVTWADEDGSDDPQRELAVGDVLVGEQLAERLELGPLAASPTVQVDGRALRVAGVLRDSERMPALTGALVVPTADGARFGPVTQTQALLLSSAGAAQQVADLAPVVMDPVRAEDLVVTAPTDPRSLRDEIEGDVRLAMTVLTGVALLAAVLALMNSMVMAVNERRPELALRRALGATRGHLAGLILGESAVTGALGGVFGLLGGLGGVLTVTVLRHWAPVIDLRVAPVAVVGGILIGALGGLLAAVVGTRVHPGRALRH